MNRLAITLALILALAGVARATCSDNGNSCTGTLVAATPTAIVGANSAGRCYVFVQNTGGTNDMHLALGSVNTAAVTDMRLAPYQSYLCSNFGGKGCPGGDVSLFSTSGTTYSYLAMNC